MGKRRLLCTIAFASSLLLCAATLTLWVQSYWKPITHLLVAHPTRTVFVASSRGRLRIWSQEVTPAPPEGFAITLTVPHKFTFGTPNRTRGGTDYNWPDKQYEWSRKQHIGSGSMGGAKAIYRFAEYEWHFQLAWWLPAVVSLLPAVFFLWMWRIRRRRSLSGKCQTCGYDLTANTSGVCPECGTAIAEERKPTA